MKISELVIADREQLGDAVYGVEVDAFCDDVLWDLKEIGILAALEPDEGGLSLDVMDTVLAYVSSGTRVLLEIPFEVELESRDMVILAMNCGVDLSLLPPQGEPSEAQWQAYADRLCEYAKLWVGQANAQKMVYPVTGFFQYMVTEAFCYRPESVTTDPYIQANFVDCIPEPEMDAIKDQLRLAIYEAFGGVAEFDVFVNTLGAAMAHKLKVEDAAVPVEYKGLRGKVRRMVGAVRSRVAWGVFEVLDKHPYLLKNRLGAAIAQKLNIELSSGQVVMSQQPKEIIAQYGVEVAECAGIDPEMMEIGIVAEEGAAGGLSSRVLRTAFAYVAQKTRVILEIPYELELDAEEVVALAMGNGFDLSVLPPEGELTDVEVGAYCRKLSEYTALWVRFSNARNVVYPVAFELFDEPLASKIYRKARWSTGMVRNDLQWVAQGVSLVINEVLPDEGKIKAFVDSFKGDQSR